jgi:NAD(P)-dependent dehydrogenase (short-subunit alcohol dehydrogenase family)
MVPDADAGPVDAPLDPLGHFRLDGRVAIVTGASSGIGSRAARVLDALGATVVVSARRTDRIDALARSLAHADAITCDVSVPGASAALVEQTVERHGAVDVVFANAGITTTAPALREPLDRFAEVVAVDLVAPFELAQAAVVHMRAAKRGGSIVNVASAAAFTSTSLLPQAGYVAAKTGLVGLTRELALQWARYGVRVNALCPGMFASEMTAALVDVDELRTRFESSVPLQRIGAAHELDGAIAFLASPASSYVTGTTLLVDGGGRA